MAGFKLFATAGQAVRAAALAGLLALSAPGPAAAQMPADAPPESVPLAGIAQVMARLEGVLGRSLLEDERVRCLDAGRRALAAAREQQVMFVHALADLFKVPPAEVAGLFAASPDEPLAPDAAMLTRLELLVGRRISPEEWRRVDELDRARLLALEPVRAAYARDLASVTGLAPEAVSPLLPGTGI